MSERVSQRVLLRYKQALRVPPRDLVRFAKKFATALLERSAQVRSAFSAVYDTKTKSNVSSDHWTLMRKLEIPKLDEALRTVSLMEDALQRLTQVTAPTDAEQQLANFFYTSGNWHQTAIEKMQTAVDKITPGVVEDFLKDNDLEWNEKYEEGMPTTEIHPYYDLRMALAEFLSTYREAQKNWKALRSNDNELSALEPASIETLYHASLFAKKLHDNGFDKAIPGDIGLGLGGSKSDRSGKDSTSFTYDVKYALDLARTFKELALIAHGEITAKQILNWAKQEGTAERVADYLINVSGGRRDNFTIRLEKGEWIVRSFNGDTQDVNEFYDSPDRVALVYNAYIKHHHFRKDPFILNIQTLVKNLKSVDPSGIGVVAAEVNMTHPEIRYNPGEREVRVPPEAILRTTRFYR